MRKNVIKMLVIVMLLSNMLLGFQVIYSGQATPVKDEGTWNLILNLNRTRAFIYLLNQNIYLYLENITDETLLQNISILLEIAYNSTFEGDFYLNLTIEQYNLGNYSIAKEYAITALHFYHNAIKNYMKIKCLLNISLEIIICEENVLKNRWVKYYNVTVYTGYVNKSPGLYTEYLRMRYKLDQYSMMLENIVSRNESIINDPLYIETKQLLENAIELYETGFNALKNNDIDYAINISTSLHKLLAEININIRKLSLKLTLYYIENYVKKKFSMTGMPEWVKKMTKNIRNRIKNGDMNKALKELREFMKKACMQGDRSNGKDGNQCDKGERKKPGNKNMGEDNQYPNRDEQKGNRDKKMDNKPHEQKKSGNQNDNNMNDNNNNNNEYQNNNNHQNSNCDQDEQNNNMNDNNNDENRRGNHKNRG